MSTRRKAKPAGTSPRRGAKSTEPAQAPAQLTIPRDIHGRPTRDVETAVLNAPQVGFLENLGDLILKVIAPGVLTDMDFAPHAWEPPEGAALRHLAMELAAIAEWVDQGNNSEHGELPNLLRALAERAEASRDLAYRLRLARFGTSPTWGGVPAPEGKVTP